MMAGRVGRGRVQAIQYIVTNIEFQNFASYSVVHISLQKQYIAILYSSISIGIGIARGQYYWILGALFGIVLTLIPSQTFIDENL